MLCSGGLDSAVLLASRAAATAGASSRSTSASAWRGSARNVRVLDAAARRSRRSAASCRSRRCHVRHARRLSAQHWAIRGEAPGFDTPDEDVYLEGRNVVLLSKAAVFMARARLTRVLHRPARGQSVSGRDAGVLRRDGARRCRSGWRRTIAIEAPFAALHKADVIGLGRSLGVPFELTLSCMQPSAGLHCGRCSKCRERRDAFREAGVEDPTQLSQNAERPLSIRVLVRVGSGPCPRLSRGLGQAGTDRAVARCEREASCRRRRAAAQRARCSRPCCRSSRAAPTTSRSLRIGAVAGVGVEVGAEALGQVERHAAVAGGDVPVVRHLAARLGAIDDRAVAGVQLDAPSAGR